MPPPPPAEGFASRLFLGPALRTQPDRRLVSLVREGYETAFEEIVRRYNKVLGRYAAAIVPRHRAEDVTQDAFSKALLALRHSEAEIELRPWLFRIVRNTALNDLRDQPPSAQELAEQGATTGSALDEALRHEDLADLMKRLRALPEPQRAAIVMRELEGLSHEEIAAALGITGGAARQAIYRARRALRDGVGLLIPLPLLKALLAGGAAAPAGAAGATVGGTSAGAAAGTGAGVAMKTAAATLIVAGTVGTGVAIEQRAVNSNDSGPPAAGENRQAGETPGGPTAAVLAETGRSGSVDSSGEGERSGSGGGSSDDRSGDREHGGGPDNSGPGGGGGDGERGDEGSGSGDSSGPGSGEASSGSGSGDSGGGDHDNSGPGSLSGSSSGSGSGSGSSGSGSGSDSSGSGSGSGTSGSSGSGSSGSGSGTSETTALDSSGSGSSGGSGSGSSGSGSSGSESSGELLDVDDD